MIDYDKLKTAIELMNKYCKKEDETLGFQMVLNRTSKYENSYHFDGEPYLSIDDLITKLQELGPPKTKYTIGQKVWHINDEYHPESMIITEIDTAADEMYLSNQGEWWLDDQLHSTKAALIASQIKYWASLGKDCHDDECQHESDGEQYQQPHSFISYLKCIKCGEYYR
jgi:hypothetical protein